jgi:hypothetical protein
MDKKVLLTVLLVMATVFSASAQKFKPAPNFLKGQEQVNLVFDYSKTVFDGDSQKEYYENKGKDWVEEWEGKRREANAKAFLESFNDEMKKVSLKAGDYPDAQYTIIVDVVDCDFGNYAGPFSNGAKLKCTLKVVKTGTADVLSTITLKESQNPYSVGSTPVDFDRMYLAFGEVGEEVGEKLVKVLK